MIMKERITMSVLIFDNEHKRNPARGGISVHATHGDKTIEIIFTDMTLCDYFGTEVDSPENAENMYMEHKERLHKAAEAAYSAHDQSPEESRLVITREVLEAHRF